VENPLPFAVTGNQARGVNGLPSGVVPVVRGLLVGDFITEVSSARTSTLSTAEAYRIGCKAWLAPFDLGVSQHIKLETVPTDLQDVYDLRLTLNRVSGDISNWKRVNRRFLNTLRKQFLIWRTLNAAERDRYLEDLDRPVDTSRSAAGAHGSGPLAAAPPPPVPVD
jgi:hypothetical protein